MKSRRILSLVALAVLLFGGDARSQELANRSAAVAPSQSGTVTERAPGVKLKTVGREVAPGVFEVDPASIPGKRLILPPNNGGAARSVCIGKHKNGECKGIFIEW